jgi:hypothetical protein
VGPYRNSHFDTSNASLAIWESYGCAFACWVDELSAGTAFALERLQRLGFGACRYNTQDVVEFLTNLLAGAMN